MKETGKNKNKARQSRWLGKRDMIEWGVILAVGLVLYTTGLHTEVIGRLQQVVLWTGLVQPDTEMALSEQEAAELDMALVSMDGERVNLADFRGKVIFLNYWATWCPPCIAEMPNIQALYEHYEDEDNVAFVMISMDEKVEKAQTFLDKKEFTFPVYRLAGSRPQSLQSTVLPTTIVINKEGNIVVKKSGMANYNTSRFRNFMDSIVVH